MNDDLRSLRRDLNRLAHTVTQGFAAENNALGLINAKSQRTGATLTNLAVGATDVTITWPQPFPDTVYGVYVSIVSGGAAIGALFAQLKNATKTTSGCTVTVQNVSIAVIASAAIDVLGLRT